MQFKLFNLLYYISVAAFGYLNVYLNDIGLASSQIGIINSVATGAALLALPMWGILSDYYGINKKLLMFTLSGAIVFSLSLLLTDSFFGIMILMVLFLIFRDPIVPLFDAQLLSYLGDKGEEYGKYRVWGSLGYTLMMPVIGFLLERSSSINLFYIIAVSLIITLFTIKKLPEVEAKIEVASLKDFKILLAHQGLLIFIIFAFFLNMTMRINQYYFPIYIVDNGGREFLVGIALMLAAGSEMVTFYFSEEIIGRFKLKQILLFTAGAFALRWMILSIFTDPIIILSSQLLHSVTFGLFHVTAINYINRVSGSRFKATGQNLYATVNGVSAIVGSLIGGYFYDILGGSRLYFYLAIIAILSGIYYYIFAFDTKKGYLT